MNEQSAANSGILDTEKWQAWVGRTQTQIDASSGAPLAGLGALLDHDVSPWPAGELPPLAHWLYFPQHQPQSMLDIDGHPKRGDFLPPVLLPRRMWASSHVKILAPIPVGAEMARRSTISAVTGKRGRTGPMIFVTVRHDVMLGGVVAIVEDQDIVYRLPPDSSVDALAAVKAAVPYLDNRRTIVSGPVQLFRFSALTFNAHRIHYDRDYARNVEGYPGLVVHGPWIATLLMDHFLRQCPGSAVTSFKFRAERPIFDIAPFEVCLQMTATGADLWAINSEGDTAMSAVIEASVVR